MIQSVERAIAILEALVDEPNGLSLSGIAESVELHAATTYHLLATLVAHDLVSQNTQTKTYRLGSKLIRLGEFARIQNNIVSVATDTLDSLAKETGELANLAVLERNHAIYLAQAYGRTGSAVSLFTRIGAQVPLYCTGVGKAMLANLPDDQIREVISEGLFSKTTNTITTEEKLREELKRIRHNGYAIDNEENMEGVGCVASPIWNSHRRVVGAISVSGPIARIKSGGFKQLGQVVMKAAQSTSEQMGFTFRESQ